MARRRPPPAASDPPAGDPHAVLFERLAALPSAQQLLATIHRGESATAAGIPAPALPFVAAFLARSLGRRLWLLCADTRRQEELWSGLRHWLPAALFLPEVELHAVSGAAVDPDSLAERLAALRDLAEGGALAVVATRGALDHPAPPPGAFERRVLRLLCGPSEGPLKLSECLVESGYQRTAQAAERGTFALRGGILDVFPWQAAQPVRLEFFGDDIDSLRHFDPDSQRSVASLTEAVIPLEDLSAEAEGTVAAYLQPGDLVVSVGDAEADPRASLHLWSHLPEPDLPCTALLPFEEHPAGDFAAGDVMLTERLRLLFFGNIRRWLAAGHHLRIVCANEGEQSRLAGLLREAGFDPDAAAWELGPLTRGFACEPAGLVLLADAEIFGRAGAAEARRGGWQRARRVGRQALRFDEFTDGDLVVHMDHGIARYRGLGTMPDARGQEAEVLTLEYANQAVLYVPLDQAWKVSRYVGIGRKSPALSELGSGRWQKARSRAERSIYQYAGMLLRLQAERESKPGRAFPPDTPWQEEFERAFLFRETPDQLRAIEAVKRDMEAPRPMDRLICGDVGYGKTEVAIRAAFKAVTAGCQVAFLAPTTVLAGQHWQTLRERMSDYPVQVDVLSRFRTPRQQKETLARLEAGGVDIIVGTHRLLGRDVRFKNLGLVIVDEEQRFGVLHKERLKEAFPRVDVLTLSATPIPRTLYLSLLGARDMSTIETPPANRIPVETVITGYDERLIREAIDRELARGGQVYFLHNRVQSIEVLAQRLRELCPEARLVVGHGQMPEDRLEEVMERFVRGEADVLLCTTIIESGLDIPNANTIIIDRADRFGLADLYQLRGRVGRSHHKAHAYLLLPRELLTTGDARKRLHAVRQYSSLGAGFRIAMRDLEIRGAGNLLGTEQSGHILTIGFDLYCRLLKRTVASLQGLPAPGRTEVPVALDFLVTDPAASAPGRLPAWLPAAFIPEPTERIELHRRLAQVSTLEELEEVTRELRDRYGRLPPPVRNFLKVVQVQVLAAEKRLDSVETEGDVIRLRRHGDYIMIGHKHPRLSATDPAGKLRQVLSLLHRL